MLLPEMQRAFPKPTRDEDDEDADEEEGEAKSVGHVQRFQDMVGMWGRGKEVWQRGVAPSVLVVLDAVNQLRNETEHGGTFQVSRVSP